MAAAKDCHALTSYFVKTYKSKYGSEPNVNRYSARWGFDAVLQSIPGNKAKDLIEYYLRTASKNRHDLDWFFYNYDKLLKAMVEAHEDSDHRARLREESKKRAEEWRKSGKQGITDA